MPTSAMWTGDGSHAEARVALVGDEHEAAGVGADEVRAGDAGLRLHVFLPEIDAGAAGDGFRIVVVIGGDAFALEGPGDFAAVLVDDRLDDVRGLVAVELDDELAEVGLQALDAVFDQERIEVDFLGRHRLGLGELRDAVACAGWRESSAAHPRRWRRSGHCTPRCSERFLGLGEIVAEVVERVVLDGCRRVSAARRDPDSPCGGRCSACRCRRRSRR